MRSTRATLLLESLESRALLTSTVFFQDMPNQVVNDKVGAVHVTVGLTGGPGDSAPVTFTLTTSGGTAVPGVDYTPVQQTITLTPTKNPGPGDISPSEQVSIPILPGPASLGTRVLQVSISPSSDAPDGASEYFIITHGTDTTSPYVVNSQALTQGGKVIAFSLQFSKPMAFGPVTDLANYTVDAPKSALQIGGAILSSGEGLGYTKNIPLKSATYDAATNTIYLVPVNPVKPNKAAAILHVAFQVGPPTSTSFSNLADTSGNPIASDSPAGFPSIGTFAQVPDVAKASPAELSYLFGVPTQATPTGHARPRHKVK